MKLIITTLITATAVMSFVSCSGKTSNGSLPGNELPEGDSPDAACCSADITDVDMQLATEGAVASIGVRSAMDVATKSTAHSSGHTALNVGHTGDVDMDLCDAIIAKEGRGEEITQEDYAEALVQCQLIFEAIKEPIRESYNYEPGNERIQQLVEEYSWQIDYLNKLGGILDAAHRGNGLNRANCQEYHLLDNEINTFMAGLRK